MSSGLKSIHGIKARMNNAPARQKTLLILALILAAVVCGRLAWTAITAGHERLDESIAMRTMELERLSAILAEGNIYHGLHAELAEYREHLLESRFLKAATPPLSEALFQHVVNEWADKARINVLSLRVLPRTEQDGIGVLRMVVNTRGEIGAIRNFLVAVRQSPRFVFFEEVEIKTISRNERREYYFNAQLVAWTMI